MPQCIPSITVIKKEERNDSPIIYWNVTILQRCNTNILHSLVTVSFSSENKSVFTIIPRNLGVVNSMKKYSVTHDWNKKEEVVQATASAKRIFHSSWRYVFINYMKQGKHSRKRKCMCKTELWKTWEWLRNNNSELLKLRIPWSHHVFMFK
jgi:hypothetical protein